MLGSFKKNLLFWQFALLITVIAIGASIDITHRNDLLRMMPEARFNPSSYNDLNSGCKGFYDLCAKLGYKAGRWEKPYRYLLTERIQALMIIVAPAQPLTQDDMDCLLRWVALGNTIVYLDFFDFSGQKSFLGRLALGTNYQGGRGRQLEISMPSAGWGKHVGKVVVNADRRLTGGKPVLVDSSGCLLAEVVHGRGRILIGSCPTLAINQRFSNRACWGNMQLLANWIGSAKTSRILFDEYCHFISQAKNVFVVFARGPGGFVSLVLVVLLVVAVAGAAQRFGAKKEYSQHRLIANSEFVSGMANTYKRAQANSAAWSILFAAMKQTLAKGLGCAPDESIETIAQLWSQHTGLQFSDCQAFLHHATKMSVGDPVVSAEELLALNEQAQKLMEASGDIFKPRHFA